MKGYVTTKELAERLGISSTRVRQMILNKQIKAEWIGQMKVIPESEAKRIEQIDRPTGRPRIKKKGD